MNQAASLQKELDQELTKRDRIREKQFQSRMNGSVTRARTTTSNAEADRCNDRIIHLREELKKLNQ